MLTDKQLQDLKSENQLLLLQLEDVNEVIQIREEELDILRQKAATARQLQSRLDMNLHEFEQMQNRIGQDQQEASAFNGRMGELENELYAAVKEQLQYAETLKDYSSIKANLQYTETELEEANGIYRQLKDIKSLHAEAESNLEIAQMEIKSLKEEIAELKELNNLIREKKLD